jgi:hypothetical protein
MSWELTEDYETFMEWTGKDQLDTLMVHIIRMDEEPPEENWWVIISFTNIDKYLRKGFSTREEAITEAKEQRRILGLFKQILPMTLDAWNSTELGKEYDEMDGDAFFLSIEVDLGAAS